MAEAAAAVVAQATGVVEDEGMAAAEEVMLGIGAIEATRNIAAATEGAAAMATAVDISAITTSSHTIFKARSLYIF